MGNVMITYKIMPEGTDSNLDRIRVDIKEIAEEHGSLKGSNEEEVAFGLKAIIARIVIPDEGGIVDKIEEKLEDIEEVQSVKSEDITLID
ncbi:MAG: elongation factor 1-beta [Candidatus Thermoplasmatota archaeon]|nr:elongation factor 1-beta [Candidatus Thermoplasmatota archaeon]MBS3789356.1 elongation factor 1-beta [Candidatus Thermoplasmatota archaeon]